MPEPMIAVVGEALVDLVSRPDGSIVAVPGGGPYNAARSIGRLGGRVGFFGALSDDRFGARLRTGLVESGVDVSAVTHSSLPTTLALAELDDTGSATYRFYFEGTAAPQLQGLALPDDLAVLHVGTLGLVLEPMAAASREAVQRAGSDVLVFCDPNCRPSVIADRSAYAAGLATVLERADVVKFSTDDLDHLAPGVDPVEAAAGLIDPTRTVGLITGGGAPVRVIGPFATFDVAVPSVAVVDTIGAGDSFGGAFCAWWVRHQRGGAALADPDQVRAGVASAVAVAAITCTRAGAEPPWAHELGAPEPR